jgi:hypothetical protein
MATTMLKTVSPEGVTMGVPRGITSSCAACVSEQSVYTVVRLSRGTLTDDFSGKMERGVHPEHFEDRGVEVREVGDELVPCWILFAEPGEVFAQFVLDLRVLG